MLGSRPGPRRGSPHPSLNFTPAVGTRTARAVGRGQVGVGSPGGKLEGSSLRPVPPRHPATTGRSFRARGASQGAAMLSSSQRTWGGLGGRSAGGGREDFPGARGDPGGPRGAGGGVCGARLSHPRDGSDFSARGCEVQGRMNVP